MKPIYLDNHATTQVDPRVIQKMIPFFGEVFGNASSEEHIFGDMAADAVEEARKEISSLVNVDRRNLHFCSGATEAINIGIKGFANHQFKKKGKIKIAASPTEHKAVLATCQELFSLGLAELILIGVDSKGRIDLQHLENICEAGLDLICTMAANNETGNLNPISSICDIGRKRDVPVFCDASQAVGKTTVDFSSWGVSMAAFSAHKMYGPKGVGAIFSSNEIPLAPILHGGTQENGLRPGSLNVPGIVGFGEACRIASSEISSDEKRIRDLRDYLENYLLGEVQGSVINGDRSERLPGTLNISFTGVPNSAVIARVRNVVAVSSGSACTSGVEAPSHVLVAMGLDNHITESAIRFGIGKFNTFDEVFSAGNYVAAAVKETIKKL